MNLNITRDYRKQQSQNTCTQSIKLVVNYLLATPIEASRVHGGGVVSPGLYSYIYQPFIPKEKKMNAPIRADLSQVQDPFPNDSKSSAFTVDLTAKPIGQIYKAQKSERFIIENLFKENSLYTLTAPNNGGKSTLATFMLECVAKRKNFGHLRTDLPENYRCLLLSGEDTDDTANKMKALGITGDHPIDIIDKSFTMEEQVEQALLQNKHRLYSLVIVDSLQAYGGGSNDNIVALNNIKAARRLTGLNGTPSVIVLAHPVKHYDPNNLIPYGGNAVMNEVSGNYGLNLDLQTNVARLSLGKKRQKDIDSINFLLNTHDVIDPETGLPLFDNFDNPVTTTSFSYLDPTTAESKAIEASDLEHSVLTAIQLAIKTPSKKDIAREIYGNDHDDAQYKQISRAIDSLRKQNCLNETTNTLTEKGRKKQKKLF